MGSRFSTVTPIATIETAEETEPNKACPENPGHTSYGSLNEKSRLIRPKSSPLKEKDTLYQTTLS
jgi:hypothetical protein